MRPSPVEGAFKSEFSIDAKLSEQELLPEEREECEGGGARRREEQVAQSGDRSACRGRLQSWDLQRQPSERIHCCRLLSVSCFRYFWKELIHQYFIGIRLTVCDGTLFVQLKKVMR